MNQLDLINPYDDIFYKNQDKSLKKELEEICGFYCFTMRNLINPEAFYYYEMLKETRELNKLEEFAYEFYSNLIDIFLQRTDNFVNKISNHINDEELKILIKQQRLFEKDAGAD